MSEFIDNTAPAGGETPATSAPTTQSAPVVAQPTTPAVQSQPAATPAGGESQVPSYRLRQQREQYENRIAQQEAAWQAKHDAIQRQLHSLVGVTPPANPEIDQIKQQFGQLYPDSLAKLADPRVVERLLQVMERADDIETQTQHYWTTYGRQSLDRLFNAAEKTLGAPLSDAGKQQLHAAFTGYISNNPEASERYANDPRLVDDFWKAFSSNLIDPVRRTAAAGVQDRVPGNIPQDTPGGTPRATPAPQPANLDERMNLAWAMYNKPRG